MGRLPPRAGDIGTVKALYILAVAMPVISVVLLLTLSPALRWLSDIGRIGLTVVLSMILGGWVVPIGLALAATLSFLALRAVARAFVGELSALARGDAPLVRAPRADPKKDLA